MSTRNNGLRGNRSITNAAFQWRSELAKLPCSGVTWSWSDVVGEERSKCDHAAAYKMSRADYIIKHEEGVYETSEALEEYLSEHGFQLEAWRASLNDAGREFVGMNGVAIAERVEGDCECLECGDVFSKAHGVRMHCVRVHASERSCEEVAGQTTLERWERVNDALRKGSDGQTQLIA